MPLREARLRRVLRNALGYGAVTADARARAAGAAAEESARGLFTQDQAFYVPHTIYPFLSCGGCVFFRGNACAIVEGEIKPEGLCNFFSVRSTSPAAARIQRAALRFGRGPPERAAPAHRLLLEVGRTVVYPEEPMLTVHDVKQPLLYGLLMQAASEP